MLGPLVTAYEQAMSEGDGKNTWRTDRYAPCPRRDAGRYLAFLASAGYQLSIIEECLVDDVPYTGDTPPTASLADEDGSASPAEEPGPDGEDVTGDADPGGEGTRPGDTGCGTGQAAA